MRCILNQLILIAVVLTFVTGCATIQAVSKYGTRGVTTIVSTPEGAKVYYRDSQIGTTPMEYEFTSNYNVEPKFYIVKDGYVPSIYYLPQLNYIKSILTVTYDSMFNPYFLVFSGPDKNISDMYLVHMKIHVKLKTCNEVVKELVNELKSKDKYVQRVALAKLSEAEFCSGAFDLIENSGVIEHLAALKNKDSDVRRKAAEVLAKIGTPAVASLIIATLKDKDWVRREEAVWALGEIKDNRAIEPLIVALLNDEYWNVRRMAAESLGKIGDLRAVEPLLAALKEEDRLLREKAVEALDMIDDPRIVESLIPVLRDKDEFVQHVALKKLCDIGDERAFEPLVDIIKTSKNIDILSDASECSWKVGGKKSVATLIEILKEDEESVRARAAFALGIIGPLAGDATPSLIEQLKKTKLTIHKTSFYEYDKTTGNLQRQDIQEMRSFKKAQWLMQTPEGMQIQIEEQFRYGFSPTKAAVGGELLGEIIGTWIVEGIRDIIEDHKIKERIKKEIEEREIEELKLIYELGRHVEIDDTSFKEDGAFMKVILTYTLQAGSYALNKITGQDFGEDLTKWQEWWEKNKTK